ncbi:hypothetical protein BYT27DRAFT_7343084 [Phlegmacium glaucopus]|nr:hypothetical protein BYT27DRAFT_7343084 [Phlegmacium glaucopus]
MPDDNNSEGSRNDSIRTLAIFFAATAVGLLSFVEAVYTKREGSSTGGVSDDITHLFLLLSMLFSLSVAALRRPRGNVQIADFVLRLSFLTLLIGTLVFVWFNLRRVVSICFTVAFVLLALAYLIWTDPDQTGEALSGRFVRIRDQDGDYLETCAAQHCITQGPKEGFRFAFWRKKAQGTFLKEGNIYENGLAEKFGIPKPKEYGREATEGARWITSQNGEEVNMDASISA